MIVFEPSTSERGSTGNAMGSERKKKHTLNIFIIQLSYTVRIPIVWLVDLYHVTLGYDATTSSTSLSWCNSRGVNSIHHCHYTMALADLNNKKVNALIARELSGFTCTRSLTMNSKFFNTARGRRVRYWNFSFIVSELVQVNPDNSLAECVNL